MGLYSHLKAILFDFDDTLIRTVEFSIDGWMLSAQQASLAPKDACIWRARWGGRPTDLVRRIYDNEISEEKATEVLRIKQDLDRDKIIPPINGAIETLDLLAQRYALGIVTSRDRGSTTDSNRYKARDGRPLYSLLEFRVDSSGFNLGDFVFMIASNENQYHKPDPRVFNKPAEFLAEKGIAPQETCYVGDDTADYKAARDSGIPFFAVLTGVKTREDFLNEGCSAEVILPSVAYLPEKLRL